MPHERFSLGPYDVTPMCDGWAPLPLTDELPDVDVDWRLERTWYPWAFPEDDLASWAWHVHAFLIRHPDGLALVDSGIGHFGRPPFGVVGRIDDELAAEGVAAEDIGDVVLTHLHADHSGGVCRPDGGIRFRNARHHVHPDDWTFFAEHRSPSDFTGRFAMDPIRDTGLLELRADDYEIAPGFVLRHAPGHTPGHRVVQLDVPIGELWLVGDLLHTPPQIAHPTALSEHDEDRLLGARSRTTIVHAAIELSRVLAVSHFGRPFGRVEGTAAAPEWSTI